MSSCICTVYLVDRVADPVVGSLVLEFLYQSKISYNYSINVLGNVDSVLIYNRLSILASLTNKNMDEATPMTGIMGKTSGNAEAV